ncbi:hypothetical protein [Calidifontibacillus oryziterrae]|uniref:hypothetical protein n=1 Tax=Calidifontibacillus oryziterrae TaxID=1191699 RepID=UPI0002D605B1|nr:hypothetical protein [Calidifontibacillus oryziterrae]
MLNKEISEIKKQLDNELRHIHFSNENNVLERSHPRTFLQKIKYWWNKEITIPLVPVGAIIVIVMGSALTDELGSLNSQKQVISQQRQLVKIAGNIYWNDLVEEELRR